MVLLVSLSTWRYPYLLVELCAFVIGALFFEGSSFTLGRPEREKSVLVPYGERGHVPAIQVVEQTQGGQWIPHGEVETQSRKVLLTNWQPLKRAELSEQRVLAAAEVQLRPPGLWETHRVLILAVATAIILQAILIAGLLLERFWRRKTEASLRQAEERLSLAAQDALRESEARFRAMADTAPVMIWMAGTDKLCTYFNKGWLDFTGRVLEQELGNGWAEGVHREDLDRCLGIYINSFEARYPFTMEYRLRRKDGEYRWVLDSGGPRFAQDGMFLGYIGSCIDVTEHKQAQDRFRLVVEASPSGILLVDSQGHIVLVNARAEKMFGYEREEILGKPIELLVPERFSSDHPAYRAGFYAKPAARAMGAGRDLFARQKDGTEFPVEIRISPIQTAEGMVVLCAVVDITERKQAEAEARKHRDELAHLSRVAIMGEMAGSLAHELNQPLTGIVNNASAGRRFIAKGRADLQKLDSLLEAIGEDGRRAGGIIGGIRAMVQKRKHVRVAVNLNDVIASVLRFVHSDALERHCALVTEADPALPLVEGDQVQLQQVLLNLIMNAFEAMGETPLAERRVIIRSECTSNGRVRVSVRDFGTGLSVDDPERIFEHFFSTKQNGLGMGLAIVRSIITSHDGELAAVNAEGGGTCAYFSLPGIGEGDA
jgi:two-component system, LuxR family, sensor kinase FixL